MPLSEEKIAELLTLLDSLGQLENQELLMHFTSENIETLRLIAALFKEDMEIERVLSENRFVNVVLELFETRRLWAGKLYETLENASREFERGNTVQALWILNGFTRFCPSPYFRDKAQEVMEEYERQGKTLT